MGRVVRSAVLSPAAPTRARPPRRALTLLLALACLAAEPSDERPIAVIVSARWQGVSEIEIPMLRSAFLGRRTRWAGARLHCLQPAAGSPIREAWSRSVLGVTDAALESYWIEEALSGGALPPLEVVSTAAMLSRVASEPGAIGYVDYAELLAAGAAAEGVRVLAVHGEGPARRPTEPGYPIVWRPPAPDAAAGQAP